MTDWPFAAAGICLVLIGLTGSWFDIRDRRLPNWLSLASLVAGLGFSLAAGGWAALGAASAHFLIALTIGAGLYAARMIGAGDAKFYAAVAAFFPWWDAAMLAGAIGIGGLLLLLVWLSMRRFARRGTSRGIKGKQDAFAQLPFGVAIALGSWIAWFGLQLT